MHTIAIIGVGRVGGSLALALPADRYEVVELVVRDRSSRPVEFGLSLNAAAVRSIDEISSLAADTLIVSTQDDKIESAMKRLEDIEIAASAVLHTSGSLSSEILAPLRTAKRAVGSIHPLVSLSDPALGAERLRGSFFCVEGDAAAVDRARKIAEDLGGHPFSIDREKKALYHGAAVIASGHFVALLDVSLELMSKCGIDSDLAKRVVLPLVESTLSNIRTQSLPEALTGTFARGDLETFERHVEALRKYGSKRSLEIYLLLGDVALDLASRRGVGQATIDEIRKKISIAKSSTEC